MTRDKALKFFLTIPVARELLKFAIDLLVKKYSLRFILGQYLPTKKLETFKFSETTQWIIRISSPSGPGSKSWGDTYFAQEIKNSLEKLGYQVSIMFRDEQLQQPLKSGTIVLTLRGLLPFDPVKNALNIIWIISHPSQITKHELKKFDLIFAASSTWAKNKSKKWNLKISPLLQATNPDLFNLGNTSIETKNEIIFIGNSRGVYRQTVRVASQVIDNFKVIGTGWEKFLSPRQILSKHVSNSELPKIYRGAKLVLNDHWTDMAESGFISNRVFDVAASGGTVVTDYLPEIPEIFGDAVLTYKSEEELVKILKNVDELSFRSDELTRLNSVTIGNLHSFDQRISEIVKKVKSLS